MTPCPAWLGPGPRDIDRSMSVGRQYPTGVVAGFREYEIAGGNATRRPSERHATVDLQSVFHRLIVRPEADKDGR